MPQRRSSFLTLEGFIIEYRVEKKFLVSDSDLKVLAARLETCMKKDINQQGKAYTIRSLYFDDIHNSCMDENEAGVDSRRKFRVRTYSASAEKMYLEIKEKHNGYTRKNRDAVTRQECMLLMEGKDLGFGSRKAVNALTLEAKNSLMRPKVIIDYERTAFVYPLGNVRVTFDRNITASRSCGDFLSDNISQKVAVLRAGMHVLEVKYDEFLPDIIAQLLELGNLSATAFSKYYLGRLAVGGELIY